MHELKFHSLFKRNDKEILRSNSLLKNYSQSFQLTERRPLSFLFKMDNRKRFLSTPVLPFVVVAVVVVVVVGLLVVFLVFFLVDVVAEI